MVSCQQLKVYLLLIIISLSLVTINCFIFAQEERDEFNQNVEKWLRFFYALSPDVKIEIGKVRDSEFEGMKQLEVTFISGGRETKQLFYVTDDRQHLIIGEVVELSKDPRKDVMSKISVDEAIKREKVVTIIEYGDFQCAFCKKAYEVIEKILKEYKGRVQFIWKHFPLTDIHPWALQAAVCSQCAAEQDKFWEFYKYFFENQTKLTRDNFDKEVTEFARKQKLDIAKFNRCIASRATLDKISKDINEGIALKINATPTFVINGIIIRGARTYEELKKIIEDELK